jgi:hypothetical protein
MRTPGKFLEAELKGIVQRILTGVETRLKRSTLMTYTTAKYPFSILKKTPSQEKHKTGFSFLIQNSLTLTRQIKATAFYTIQ